MYIRLLTFITSIALSCSTLACPRIGSLIDFNCDQMIKIVFVGDSVVYGKGDSDYGNIGGYVSRIAKLLPRARISNLGIPGITTGEMIRRMKVGLASATPNAFRNKLQDADLIVIDMGRNDYWEDISPNLTVTNLRRIVAIINQWYSTKNVIHPYIAVNTLIPVSSERRRYQVSFIKDLNKELIRQSSMKLIKIPFRLEKTPEYVLSGDGIHPSSKGYTAITHTIFPHLRFFMNRALGTLRPDSDKDGVYNIAETKLFKTNPLLIDTDHDGFSDGYELFTSKTSPKNASEHP